MRGANLPASPSRAKKRAKPVFTVGETHAPERATSEAARALGLERETGRLAPGLAADVLVLDGNPLEDLGALLRPVLVLARGRVVRR